MPSAHDSTSPKRDFLEKIFMTTLHDLISEFLATICKPPIVDDDDMARLDWYDMSVGWALAKGLTVDQAFEFARAVRYEYQYGEV